MFRYALLCRDYVHTVVFTPRWCYHLRSVVLPPRNLHKVLIISYHFMFRVQASRKQATILKIAFSVKLCRRRYIDIFTYRCKRHVRDSDCACYIQSHKHFFLTDQLEV